MRRVVPLKRAAVLFADEFGLIGLVAERATMRSELSVMRTEFFADMVTS